MGEWRYLNRTSGNNYEVYTDSTKTVGINTIAAGAWTAGGTVWQTRATSTTNWSNDNNMQLPAIVVGLGNRAVKIEEYYLAEIDTGLSPQGQIRDVPVVSATKSYIRFTRDFVNASGGAITIEEIVLFGQRAGGTGPGAILKRLAGGSRGDEGQHHLRHGLQRLYHRLR